MTHPEQELEKRREQLEAALTSKERESKANSGGLNRSGNMAGTAYALKVSSEFIAAILVGVALGALIDKIAGTSPWGLIILLLLGFIAGILNVLRNAGLIAVSKSERGTDWKPTPTDTTPPGNAWADDEEDK
jgi:ATP synthase protein I